MAHGNDTVAKVKVEHDATVASYVKKACTSCGTVNTPQWREGPKGPRSLCNACGVKHLRHVRGHQRTDTAAGKAMRKAVTSGINKPQICRMKAEARCKAKSCRAEAIENRLGWANAADCSQPSSESATEVCWSTAQFGECQQQALASDCAAAAAVSLLSMTRPQSSLQLYAAPLQQHHSAAAEAKILLQQCNVTSSMPDARELHHAREQELATQRELEHTRRIEHVRACSAARFDLKAAEKIAAAADAAVAAVSKVLVVKRDEAMKAQAALCKAEKHLKQLTQQR